MALLVELVSIACARKTFSPEEAAKLIGRQKTENGKVASAHFAAKSMGQPPS
jgi:hypothetical protein